MVAPNLPVPSAAMAEPSRYGEVFDRGYKHYDGPRLGRRGAFFALVRYSIKRAVGIKKSWTAKIIPILLYVAAFVPAIIYIGVSALVPDADIWEYPDFFVNIFVIEGIFVATITPEMLCGDRRENVLSLYFSRAIKRSDYILGKLAAAALLTVTISVLPAILLWIGSQLLDDSPLTAMKNNLDDLGKILIVGMAIAFYLGAIGLLISSFTGRKSIAVAVIMIGFGVATSLQIALRAAFEDNDNNRFFVFLSPATTAINFTESIFNSSTEPFPDFPVDNFTTLEYFSGMAVIVIACILVMLWRYVPDE
jgi:hypothetical protein